MTFLISVRAVFRKIHLENTRVKANHHYVLCLVIYREYIYNHHEVFENLQLDRALKITLQYSS